MFGRGLNNIEHLAEGMSAHLEATLTPVNDPTMKVEWFCNGRPIPQGDDFLKERRNLVTDQLKADLIKICLSFV